MSALCRKGTLELTAAHYGSNSLTGRIFRENLTGKIAVHTLEGTGILSLFYMCPGFINMTPNTLNFVFD